MKFLKNGEFWCLLFLIVNLGTIGTDVYFRYQAGRLQPLGSGRPMPVATGVAADQNPASLGESCHLVRYASANCRYCSAKFSGPWDELENTLEQKGCDVTIVSPHGIDLPESDATLDGKPKERRLVGTSLEFAKATHFSSTPVTVLLDRNWRILWLHFGTIEKSDYLDAMKASGAQDQSPVASTH